MEKKCEWHDEQQAASPAVHADSLMLITAIESKEGRYAATADVTVVFLHADQDDFVVIKFVDK